MIPLHIPPLKLKDAITLLLLSSVARFLDEAISWSEKRIRSSIRFSKVGAYNRESKERRD